MVAAMTESERDAQSETFSQRILGEPRQPHEADKRFGGLV
jgi:hypothetical protein